MDLATDTSLDALRADGRWALYWELLHARGSMPAVRQAWESVTHNEREAARAGLVAARDARRSRLGEGLLAKLEDADINLGELVTPEDVLTVATRLVADVPGAVG